MTLGMIFWLLMILWILFGLFAYWPADRTAGPIAFAPMGGNLILWILLFLLGWKTFGFIIQG